MGHFYGLNFCYNRLYLPYLNQQGFSMSTILFELGTEELPPKNLKTLRDALNNHVTQSLTDANIRFDTIKSFAAPRRLALQIQGISEKQPDKIEQKRGPAVKAAYDKDGNPTKAAQGFAQGLGIDVKDLITIKGDKGDYIGYEMNVIGQPVAELLPSIFQKALDELPIAKRMRSGAERSEFVRPVKWLVLLKDDQVLPATIQGLTSGETGSQGVELGRYSLGHRFHHPDKRLLAALKKRGIQVFRTDRQGAIKIELQDQMQVYPAVNNVPYWQRKPWKD